MHNKYPVYYVSGTYGHALVYFINLHTKFSGSDVTLNKEERHFDGYAKFNNTDTDQCACYSDHVKIIDDGFPIVIKPSKKVIKQAKRRMKNICRIRNRVFTVDRITKAEETLKRTITDRCHVIDILELFESQNEKEYIALCEYCNMDPLENWNQQVSDIWNAIKPLDK